LGFLWSFYSNLLNLCFILTLCTIHKAFLYFDQSNHKSYFSPFDFCRLIGVIVLLQGSLLWIWQKANAYQWHPINDKSVCSSNQSITSFYPAFRSHFCLISFWNADITLLFYSNHSQPLNNCSFEYLYSALIESYQSAGSNRDPFIDTCKLVILAHFR